ncbi:MAG TPA: protein kinase [Alphaproteobacteria bacterium]|nr:protein kinase [Alphaproteobacteria bacterium]
MSGAKLEIQIGVASARGKRARNEDFAAALSPPRGGWVRPVFIAAVADGVGGAKGGREAAELSVRSFFDGFHAQPESLSVEQAAARTLTAINRWTLAQGRSDPELSGMATTFSALILLGREAHIAHVGDSRIYRLSAGQLHCLTRDHIHPHPDQSHVLLRAIGMEEYLHIDHEMVRLEVFDRFLLCSDGVHGVLTDKQITGHLSQRTAAEEAANRIAEAALDAGSQDNVSALVIDILSLPDPDNASLEAALEFLPVADLPKSGDVIDGYVLGAQLSDGRYSRLFHATDERDNRALVIKFPHPRITSDATYRTAFARESWVAAQVHSPYVGQIIETPPERRSRLYSVMPFYDGETLEQRLLRKPMLNLKEGVWIGSCLAKGVAALHRAGIVHRDIKPENILLLKEGELKLLDLGVALAPNMKELSPDAIPGTASYMAPEMFAGAIGSAQTDLYALGVTLYRAFSGGAYPYGEIEPFSRPRFRNPVALSSLRPDLPGWLEFAIMRAVRVNPDERQQDVLEFVFELENGLTRGAATSTARISLYERNPLRFWQITSWILLMLLIASLAAR